MPTSPLWHVKVFNCTSRPLMACVASSQDPPLTPYVQSTPVTILPGDSNTVSSWWIGVDTVLVGSITSDGPIWVVQAPGDKPFLLINNAGHYQLDKPPLSCSQTPVYGPSTKMRTLKPATLRRKPKPKPDGAIPYAQWPQWAQALLWTGVSVAGVLLLIFAVSMWQKRKQSAAAL